MKENDLLEGRYRIIRLLGEGGMGAVYLAEHTLIKRRVAIKVLHPQLATDAHLVDCFLNEARAAAMLGHPNIVESTDMGFTAEHVPYIVFEYLEGALLTDEIYRIGGLPMRRAVRIAEQIAGALHAAHEAGIVHRDLKSDNIFLTDKDDASDHVKVLDFGISRFMHGDDGHRGVVMGTPEFMAPEQMTNPEAIDRRTDVYALGVILYEMLAGRRPFHPGKEPADLQRQILTHRPPPIDRPELPQALCALVTERMLAKDPAARPGTMNAVAAALDAFMTREDGTPVPRRRTMPIAAVRPDDTNTIPRAAAMLHTPLPTGPGGTIVARKPVWLYAVAGFGAALGGLGLLVGLRGHGEPAPVAPPPVAQIAPAPAAAVPAPAAPQHVAVQIEANVPSAHVVFRRRVSAAPMTSDIAASEIVELVEVSAPGYKTERYWLTLDRPTHLIAHLVKGSGLDEASEEATLIALGEVASPAPAAAPVEQVAHVEHTVAAPRQAMAPRRIGRATADAPAAIAATAVASSEPAPAPAAVEAPAPAEQAMPAPVDVPKPAAVEVPKPAPVEAPRVVTPTVLKALRISGETHIDAPSVVQVQMERDGKDKTSATLKVCLAATGDIVSVAALKSSGYAAYDHQVMAAVQGWRFRAGQADGHAVPVCSALTFVYALK